MCVCAFVCVRMFVCVCARACGVCTKQRRAADEQLQHRGKAGDEELVGGDGVVGANDCVGERDARVCVRVCANVRVPLCACVIVRVTACVYEGGVAADEGLEVPSTLGKRF